MKNPLTSKERRGLVAVAAAALLCIGSGFIFRNCGGRNAGSVSRVTVVNNDSVADASESRRDSISGKSKDKDPKKKRGRKKKASSRKGEKAYRERSPLDEPCD